MCSFNIEFSLCKYRSFDPPTPLLLWSYSDILRIRMVRTFHITALTSNYVSCPVDSYSSRILRINTFQVINDNCNLVVFQNISTFRRLEKVHSTHIKIFTIKIKPNRHNIRLYGFFCLGGQRSCLDGILECSSVKML
jgi:hypothetical protein